MAVKMGASGEDLVTGYIVNKFTAEKIFGAQAKDIRSTIGSKYIRSLGKEQWRSVILGMRGRPFNF